MKNGRNRGQGIESKIEDFEKENEIAKRQITLDTELFCIRLKK